MPISTLIDKEDGFEIVRDQLAQILSNETAAQQLLAAEAGRDPDSWKLNVYAERSDPWEQWLDESGPVDLAPIINIWYESDSFDMSHGNVVSSQASEGTFNIDCYGYGKAGDNPAGGHVAGDEKAALECARAARLVRNILMASEYTYLDLRGLVARRWVQSRTNFQPQMANTTVQQVQAVRLVIAVKYLETAPQYQADTIGCIHTKIQRAEDGRVLAETEHGSECLPVGALTANVPELGDDTVAAIAAAPPGFVCLSSYFVDDDWLLGGAVWNSEENRVEPTLGGGVMLMRPNNEVWNPPGFQPSQLVITMSAPDADPEDYPIDIEVRQFQSLFSLYSNLGAVSIPDGETIAELTLDLAWIGPAEDRLGDILVYNTIYTNTPFVLCIEYVE